MLTVLSKARSSSAAAWLLLNLEMSRLTEVAEPT
jgi:hypothetical protein